LNALIGSEILTFICIITFAAFDFWTVKNVTGRLLVNLRWWSEYDENGNEKWIFESSDDNSKNGATDSFVFWTGLYVTPLIWGFFGLMDLFSFKFFWVNVCGICIVLSSANVIGFYKCQKDHQNKMKSFIQERTMGFAMGTMKDMVLSRIPFFGRR
jgi:hypothetical protein